MTARPPTASERIRALRKAEQEKRELAPASCGCLRCKIALASQGLA